MYTFIYWNNKCCINLLRYTKLYTNLLRYTKIDTNKLDSTFQSPCPSNLPGTIIDIHDPTCSPRGVNTPMPSYFPAPPTQNFSCEEQWMFWILQLWFSETFHWNIYTVHWNFLKDNRSYVITQLVLFYMWINLLTYVKYRLYPCVLDYADLYYISKLY